MEPVVSKVPILVRVGFVTLESAILALTAFFIFAPEHYNPSLGLVRMVLLAMLLITSYLILPRNRQMAISGFLVFFVCLFIGLVCPQFSS